MTDTGADDARRLTAIGSDGSREGGKHPNLDTVFARVTGRQPSDEQRERLHRLRTALGLRDNDAFWSIVMALEHYDSFFRRYPAELAEETRRCVEGARAAFAAAAQNEAAQVQRLLSEKVAQTSVEIARKLAGRPIGLHRVTTVLAAVVAFGGLCVSAGYSLAGTEKPFWVGSGSGGLRGAQRLLAAVLAVPAGWMTFALLMPAAVYGARTGWGMAHDEMAATHERVLGWCVVAVCLLGLVACVVMLAKVT